MNIIHTIWQGGVAHECCRGDIKPLSNFARGQKCNRALLDNLDFSFEFWGPQTKACKPKFNLNNNSIKKDKW